MIGTLSDMRARLSALLPLRWFGDAAPVLTALLSGLGEGWVWLDAMQDDVKSQTRIGTATDSLLDLIAADFFAGALTRRFGEADAAFRARIQRALLRPRATRAALAGELTALTGRAPVIFEPSRPADTGAWGIALGYGAAGGWGSLALPFQCFVTAYRPRITGVPLCGGWASGAGGWGTGAVQYVSPAMVQSQVTDVEINAAVASTLPVAAAGWTRISN